LTSTSSTPVHTEAAAAPVRRFGGALDIVLAASLWGTTGTVRSFAHGGPVSVGAARLLIGGAFLFVLAVRSGGLRPLFAAGPRTWLVLFAGAACACVYQVAFFSSAARTGVATGTVVTIGSGPAFAGGLSWLLGMGTPTRRWLVSTAGAVAGCTALSVGGHSAGVEPVGILLALAAGFGYAAYATAASFLITRGEGDRAVVGVLFAGAGVLLLPVLIGYGPGWMFTARGGTAALYLGLVTTGLGYVLYGRGLRTTPVAVATTLTIAEPAVAALLGLFVLGEHLSPIALGGLVLLVVSLLILALPTRRTG
jgi:DME family drug/metabolite transporter